MPHRNDCVDIAEFLSKLPAGIGLRGERSAWPEYLFHITGVQNAVSVLSDGLLMSRNRAIEEGRMVVDNASPDVIDQTPDWVHDNARLFFRPRTPTFYNNEGIRPGAVGGKGSHCAMPIALLFDATSVLCLPETVMSDGGLNRRIARTGQGIAYLRSQPFEQIYEDQPMRGDKALAKHRRHAEVIVPDALALCPHLRWIFARSSGELQTLVTLLERESPAALAVYRPKMIVNGRPGLFYKHWAFVESVTLGGGRLTITFNPTQVASDAGPFELEVVARWARLAGTRTWRSPVFRTDSTLTLEIPDRGLSDFTVSIKLDSCLAFSRTFSVLDQLIV